tara:strand:- start:334 stop:861 length:528 start_codon:yes stop_codon:yes gene_type:complete
MLNLSDYSKIYKTTFKNGDVHFGRVVSSKKYSPKIYLNDQISKVKSNSKNPNRINMTTEFELRVQREIDTVKCEIVFEGLTAECCQKKDSLIYNSKQCINYRKSVMNKKRVDVPRTIKKDYVKKLINPTTKEIFYYVDWSWAKSHPYFSKHISIDKSHPLHPNFKKLTIENIKIL